MSVKDMDVEKMLAGEIMHSPLITAGSNDRMQAIVEKMATCRISAVIIEEDGKKDAFIITMGDIIRWLAKHTESIANVLAKEMMQGPISTLNIMDPISKVIKHMYTRGTKRVVIENDRGEKVGIISIKDLLTWNFDILQHGVPFLLLTLMSDSGSVLSEYRFPTLQEFAVLDADLLGSSMTAISSLTSELIKASGDLKVIRKENYVFMIETGKILKAILVADKESIELRKSLRDYIVAVEGANRDLLAKYKLPLVFPLNLLKTKDQITQSFAYFLQSQL